MRRLHGILSLSLLVCVHSSDFTVAYETTVADYFNDSTISEDVTCPPISTPKISLNLNYIGLENLRDAFLTSEYLTNLSLDYNQIRTISSDTFQGLPRLVHLSLSSNNIQHLNLADFGKLENLETLLLDGNCEVVVEEIMSTKSPEDDDESTEYYYYRWMDPWNPRKQKNRCVFYFAPQLPKLTRLHLENNNLGSLVFPEGELTSLTHLYLSGNPLTMSDGTDVRLGNFAPSLRHLRLDKCGLRELDITSLKYVTEIYLGNNEFQAICSQYCDHSSLKLGAVDLDILRLNFNQISKIEVDAFNDTVKLTILDLSYNKLSYIRQGTFDKLQRLVSLNLSGNSLTRITGTSFKVLRNMRVLDLGCNLIKHIDDDAFEFWFKLEELSLHNNQLANIEHATFSHLSELKNLDLSYNRFHDVNEIYLRKRSWDTLGIEVLNLSGNPLNDIRVRWFDALSSDSVVYLGSRPSTCGL